MLLQSRIFLFCNKILGAFWKINFALHLLAISICSIYEAQVTAYSEILVTDQAELKNVFKLAKHVYLTMGLT